MKNAIESEDRLIKSYSSLRTGGMRWTENQPRSIFDVQGEGLIVWGKDLQGLSKAREEIGTDGRIILTSRDLSEFPSNGMASALGKEWKRILGESSVLTDKPNGFIGINGPLLLLAAWRDNDYWPNIKGGH